MATSFTNGFIQRNYNPSAVPDYGGLTGADRDAAVALTNLFESYGLGTLAPSIINFIKQGYSADTITVLLQQTDAYKQRFAANAVREKNGLPVLSPAEYLATEDAYRQTLRKWGLPSGFYDQPSDFQKFLEQDMSPSELDSRAQEASDFMNSADANQLAYYRQFYTQGDMVAFALDPKRAAPLVGKAFQASKIGGVAKDQGLDIDRATAEQLAGLGINVNQAQSGFGQIASAQPTLDKLSQIYGIDVTQGDLIGATFENDANANKKINKLASRERAAFGGTSGVSSESLASGGQL